MHFDDTLSDEGMFEWGRHLAGYLDKDVSFGSITTLCWVMPYLLVLVTFDGKRHFCLRIQCALEFCKFDLTIRRALENKDSKLF